MAVANPPHELQLVIDFVNTLDLEQAQEELGSPDALGAWLGDRGLLEPGARVSDAQLRRARALRESLRSVMLAHNGGPPAQLETLQREAERGQLAVSFDNACASVLTVRSGGFDGALARLLIPVAEGTADGSWERVKACQADDCRWGFYDGSRNRSGRWCDMAVCGNRAKVRNYRARAG